eukprot:SAG31_NODE_19334_length_605_cov_1.310277_2_plen_85_part_01
MQTSAVDLGPFFCAGLGELFTCVRPGSGTNFGYDDDGDASSLDGIGEELLDEDDEASTMRLSTSGVSRSSTRKLSKVEPADIDNL